jgi:hypothetical protein
LPFVPAAIFNSGLNYLPEAQGLALGCFMSALRIFDVDVCIFSRFNRFYPGFEVKHHFRWQGRRDSVWTT